MGISECQTLPQVKVEPLLIGRLALTTQPLLVKCQACNLILRQGIWRSVTSIHSDARCSNPPPLWIAGVWNVQNSLRHQVDVMVAKSFAVILEHDGRMSLGHAEGDCGYAEENLIEPRL